MKTIIVRWVEEKGGFTIDDKAMKVMESDHPRFTKGTRFDFGFFKIATKEGYTIVSHPLDDFTKK